MRNRYVVFTKILLMLRLLMLRMRSINANIDTLLTFIPKRREYCYVAGGR